MSTIGCEQEGPTTLYEDNVGAVRLAHSSHGNPRTKHIGIKIHHIRSLVDTDVVKVEHLPTDFQRADILTKGLGPMKFARGRDMLGID